MHAIVSGASIAGLSAAYWLDRAGWQVTLLERSRSFRDGGQNVDVRGVGHDVLDRMGLTDAVRALNTTETGTVLVDENGGVTAELPSDGEDGATAELEILRGDFAKIILEALPADLAILYGTTIERVDDDGTGPVRVTTASGATLEADLLVIAEGVRSSTRELVFGEVERRELGVQMVFGTIPRTADDDDRWRWYTAPEGRQVHLRPDPHGTTRAILAYSPGDDVSSADRDALMARLRDRYAGAGWQAERVLDGFADSDDVYADYLTQIRMPEWHRGRVVAIGDAAWCVTPMGGGGASLALTSGYVLAAYLSAAPVSGLPRALERFEEWMRPLVDDIQSMPSAVVKFAYPQTRLGLRLRRLADTVMTSPPLAGVVAKVTQVADTDAELPPLVAVP